MRDTRTLTRFLPTGLAGSAALLLTAACTTQAQSTPAPALPRVAVVSAQQRDVPLEMTYTGRVEAVDAVELRPRVSGALDKVLFQEGSLVRRGTALFQIDQRPYVIAVRQAEAEVTTIAVQLTRAREEAARAERLVAADAVSVEELDRRRAEAATLEGRLDAARAAVQDALLNLEHTTVVAPVDGRVGRAEVTPGNLVNGSAGSGTRLAVLHSVNPMYVYFELDPATAAVARVSGRQAWSARVTPLEGRGDLKGPIDFVDNAVGPQTGTLKVRARIQDPAGELLPGAVVKVTFRYGIERDATAVPDVAIGTDQGSRFVTVVADGGTLEYRPVTVGTKAGSWRVVTRAVRPGELVVLPGIPGLRPGMKVAPVEEVLR